MINQPLGRKLRMGLIGGGRGSFIGRVHSIAATLDNRAEIVAGALSSDPQVAVDSAPDYGIAPDRAYRSYRELLDVEAKKPEGDRVDWVTIATPNHTHFPIAKAALERGFNVICDKPMTFDGAEAEELVRLVGSSSCVFALTHNYTGYPLMRQLREMILAGEFGTIQAVRSSYIQGWLRTRLESDNHKQAKWRTDPKKSGAAGAFGDIATHAYQLGRWVTGLQPTKLSAQLSSFEPGRELDDYGTAILRCVGGGQFSVTASQISHGRENDLRLEVDGTLASAEWHQEDPNKLIVRKNGEPMRIYSRDPNVPYVMPIAKSSMRLPGGHPEAFFEAFANIYAAAFDDMVIRATGGTVPRTARLYPGVGDGLEGMKFIEASVASSGSDGAWVELS